MDAFDVRIVGRYFLLDFRPGCGSAARKGDLPGGEVLPIATPRSAIRAVAELFSVMSDF